MLFLVLGMSQQQQVGALPGVFWSKVLVSAATKELEVELELAVYKCIVWGTDT